MNPEQDPGFSGAAGISGLGLETSPCLRGVTGEGSWWAGRLLIFIQWEHLLHQEKTMMGENVIVEEITG